MELVSKKIHNHIKNANRIIVVPHQNPDGDALGSATAFFEYLRLLQKDAVIFCATTVAESWHWLNHAQKIVTDPAIFSDKNIDAIVVLDSGDLRYAGVDSLVANHPAAIINIDHHATNEHYGELNLVVPTAAATCEILYNFFKHGAVSINQSMATSLLTGLLTDTDTFFNSATSAESMAVGGELLRLGGNLNAIRGRTSQNKSVDALRLWGRVLGRLAKDEEQNIAYTYITKKDLEECGANENESEGIANFLNNLENTAIALILKETAEGKIKGSFRTTRNDVDVSALAKKFGGGGHKKAAGFSTTGTIEEVLKKILTLY